MFGVPLLAQNDPPPHASIWLIGLITWPFGGFFLFCLAWMICELTRGEVRADENGVTWRRGFAGWKSARWDEIRDFYLHTTQTGTHTVETANGKLELSKTYSGVDAIIELIPRRVATATALAWELRGFRSQGDWSQTLEVWSKSQQWTAPVFSAMLIISCGGLFVLSLLEPRNQQPSIGFLWDSLVPLLALIFLAGPLAALFCWTMFLMWRDRKFAWNHRDEKLHLNARGLVFESAHQRVEARWDEVQRVERLPPENGFGRTRVITRGGDFTLWRLSSGEMLHLFRARCQSYAPAAIEALDRQLIEEFSLDSEINPTATNSVENGAQTFSFRTRSNRLMLGTMNLVLVLTPFFYLNSVYAATMDEPFAPSWLIFWALCALAATFSGATWLWFARASIVAADELQLNSPFRRTRHIVWNEIEATGADAWGRYVRTKGRKIYWMRWLSPARVDELANLIESRSSF